MRIFDELKSEPKYVASDIEFWVRYIFIDTTLDRECKLNGVYLCFLSDCGIVIVWLNCFCQQHHNVEFEWKIESLDWGKKRWLTKKNEFFSSAIKKASLHMVQLWWCKMGCYWIFVRSHFQQLSIGNSCTFFRCFSLL